MGVAIVVALTAAVLTVPSGALAQDDPDGSAASGPGRGSVVGGGVAAAVASGPALVVVALEVPGRAPAGGTAAAIRTAQDAVRAALPPAAVGRVVTFAHVPAMVIEVTNPAAIDALASRPEVARVDLDVGGTATLDVTVPLTGADERHAVGNDGDGVTVAVLDTGVDSDHPDLVDDVIAASQACFGYDGGTGFCPNGTDSQTGAGAAEDDEGHGTHVSGIISGGGVVASPGFAPGAEIVALKTIDDQSVFYSFTLNVVAALDYLIANPQLGVDVVNMSLATAIHFTGDCDNANAFTMAGAAAINTLRANGVTAFAAAGNTANPTQMAAPACLSNVIAVGASTDADTPASFTDVSTTTDLFAPGVNVVAAAMGGGDVALSGTSMASPSAAGCAALLIESGAATTPSAIETRLETSPVAIVAANGSSYPRIDCGLDGNDAFASAATLGGPPGTATGSNVGYTTETGEPNPTCGDGSSTDTAWWNWTAPGSGTVTIDTFGSNFDTVLAAYTGNAVDSLTPVACNDDSGGVLQSRITFAATQGTTYRIQVDGFTGQTGSITLNSSGTLCAGNDDFACAGTIGGPPATATGTNAGYGPETGEVAPSCGFRFGAGAWWNWTAPSTGNVTIDTFGSNFDTVLAVHTGNAVDALTEVACNDDYQGPQSSLRFDAIAGTTYRIRVGGNNGATGDITLNTRPTPRIRAFGTVVNPEGDSGTSTANAVILLESAPGVPYAAPTDVAFDWYTGDVPSNPRVAHPGEDFVAASGTAVIPAGATQVTVPIEIIGDTVDEPPLLYGEWGLFAANNPSDNATIDTTTFFGIGLVIVIDDD